VVRPDRTFAFRDGRKIRHVLSSANPLFTTAAEELGPVIGVVLTGKGADATDGVQSIKAAGGIVIAQDQATAEHFRDAKVGHRDRSGRAGAAAE
jgi:two-component system, chemotaxis family, protein-glutamate methylesterase/glutaminase